MNLIIDASIVIKWFIPEIYWEYATRLQGKSDLYAPDFMQMECFNILAKKVRRQEMSREIADAVQKNLLHMPIQLAPWQDLLEEATDIAHATHRSVYDCLYLVLAWQLQGKMVTADKKLYRGLQAHSEWSQYVLWIEDVQ